MICELLCQAGQPSLDREKIPQTHSCHNTMSKRMV